VTEKPTGMQRAAKVGRPSPHREPKRRKEKKTTLRNTHARDVPPQWRAIMENTKGGKTKQSSPSFVWV